MNPPRNQVDQHGFPIPPTFEENRSSEARKSGRTKPKLLKWVLGLAVLALVGVELLRFHGGSQAIANWLTQRAERKLFADDLQGALADLNHAARWAPDLADVYYVRGRVKLEANDLNGSLADFNRLIKLSPNFARAYLGRSMVWQRKQEHRKAIDDLSKAILLRPEWDPSPINGRAYARAVAGIELEQGMQDIERALAMASEADREQYAAFLDTRGFLHFRMGHYPEALQDLDRATVMMQAFQTEIQAILVSKGRNAQLKHFTRLINESLAVMLHHRGQAHEKLGHQDQAYADLRRAQELGYNPEAGVF